MKNKMLQTIPSLFRSFTGVALVCAWMLTLSLHVQAQDGAAAPAAAGSTAAGKKIFQENCSSCHMIDKDMTGPALSGVEDRVPGGRAAIYKWVKNPTAMAESDPYFKALKAKWKIDMTAFPSFTDAQIDAILDYVKNPGTKAPATQEVASMDSNPALSKMWSWIRFLLLVVVILLVNIAILVTRIRGVEIMKGVNLNRVNAWGWLVFYALLMGSTVYWIMGYKDKFFLVTNPASAHGAQIDWMFWLSMAVAFTVYVAINFLLFYFTFRYADDGSGRRKAFYYPENHKLELLWTAVPAVVLTILITFGIITWYDVMISAPPKDSYNIEFNAQQFGWNIHYPGKDNKLGDIKLDLISGSNPLGVNFEEAHSHDDFVSNDIYLPKGKSVTLTIRSRDVLHSVHMPHFRVKMDAVPGMKTRFTFTPTVTTAEMRAKLGNPEFDYQLACAEICGKGHFSMSKKIIVVEDSTYQRWLGEQQVMYDPAAHGTPGPAAEQHASIGKPENK